MAVGFRVYLLAFAVFGNLCFVQRRFGEGERTQQNQVGLSRIREEPLRRVGTLFLR